MSVLDLLQPGAERDEVVLAVPRRHREQSAGLIAVAQRRIASGDGDARTGKDDEDARALMRSIGGAASGPGEGALSADLESQVPGLRQHKRHELLREQARVDGPKIDFSNHQAERARSCCGWQLGL